MDRQYYRILGIVTVAIVTLSIGLCVFTHVSGGDLLQYIGEIIGGLLTVGGLAFTISYEHKRMYETEYRPKVKLCLSDYRYDPWQRYVHSHYRVYFAAPQMTADDWAQVQGIVPLRLENFGNSDVLIEKITFRPEDGETPVQVYQFGAKHTESFVIYSGENVDIPARFQLKSKCLLVELTYRALEGNHLQSGTVTKQYSVYIPSSAGSQRDTLRPYEEWRGAINISGRI